MAPLIEQRTSAELLDSLRAYLAASGRWDSAAERWTAAVNADGQYGRWRFSMVRKISDVAAAIEAVAATSPTAGASA